MTIQPITGILMALACLSTLGVMGILQFMTRGAWRRYGAGAALMGLWATIAAITGLAATSSFWPGFPGRGMVYVVLYCVFILSIWTTGFVIIREQRLGRNGRGAK